MGRAIALLTCGAVLALAACAGGDETPPDSERIATGCTSRPLVDAATGAVISGAEDLAVVDPDRLLFAAHDRRAVARALSAGTSPPEGGIYLLRAAGLDAAAADAPFRAVRATAPVPLRPHGIATWSEEGRIRLAVIDRRYGASGPRVRIWSFTFLDGPPRLVDARLLADGPAWCAANDLVAEPEGGRLFVSLDHEACAGPRRLWEDLFAAASGRVVALPLDPVAPLAAPSDVVADKLRWPNGLAIRGAPDGGRRLWLAETRAYRLTVLAPGPGARARAHIPVSSAPDNLTVAQGLAGAGGGDVIVAAHPSLLALALFRDNLFGVRRAQTTILRIPGDGRPRLLYAGDGSLLSAATVAAVWRGHLVATSAWDERMLVCRLEAGSDHGEQRA